MSTTMLADTILSGGDVSGLHPLEIDNAVKKYNMFVNPPLELKRDIKPLNINWNIPEKYLNIDLKEYLFNKLLELSKTECFSQKELNERIDRIKQELIYFKEYDIENLIRTTIYMVDTFESNSIVWGTGRGSSCACYSLYLIGVHEVDSILYELDLHEFFR